MIEIPCKPSGDAHWTQRTALDGRDFLLTFDWNQRDGGWRLSIADVDGAQILTGRRLSVGVSLLVGVVDPRAPTGVLFVADTQHPADGLALDPDFTGLGDRWALAYVPRAEVAG